MNMSKELEEYWNQQHIEQNQLMLTGSGIIDYQIAFDMEFKPGQRVLEIGMGTGRFITESLLLGCDTFGLDISTVAIKKTKNLMKLLLTKRFTTCWHTSEIDSIPQNFFDIIISRHVAQHMDDEDLLAQLKAIIPTLNKNGIFYLNFYENKLKGQNDLDAQKGGGVPRTKEEMLKMIEDAGGKGTHYKNIPCGFQGFIKITRADYV